MKNSLTPMKRLLAKVICADICREPMGFHQGARIGYAFVNSPVRRRALIVSKQKLRDQLEKIIGASSNAETSPKVSIRASSTKSIYAEEVS